MERSRTSGVLADNGNRLIVNRLDIVIDTGQPSVVETVTAPVIEWRSALGLAWSNGATTVTLPTTGTSSLIRVTQSQIHSLLAPGETIVGLRASGTMNIGTLASGENVQFSWGTHSQSQAAVLGVNTLTLPETAWDGIGTFSFFGSPSAGGTYMINMTQFDIQVQTSAGGTTVTEFQGQTKLDMRYSKDGGHNWSDWRQINMGSTGEFLKKLTISRLGIGREWMFEFRVTDRVKADIIALNAMIEQANS
jgi:hypothetical protein